MAASRSAAMLARRAKAFPLTVITELATIEATLGGRAQIVGMLVLAPLTPDLRYLLGLLGDPLHARTPLADLCANGNVLPGVLLRHLADAALLRGKVEAAQKIGAGIAAVTADIMQRAAPYEDACHTCQGIGTVTIDPTPQVPNPAPETCDVCRGTGKLIYRPELERQKLAVDLAQLLPKGSGVQIAVQQNNGQGAGGSGVSATLERLQALTDRVLYGADPDADVEGEVVEGVVERETPDTPLED